VINSISYPEAKKLHESQSNPAVTYAGVVGRPRQVLPSLSVGIQTDYTWPHGQASPELTDKQQKDDHQTKRKLSNKVEATVQTSVVQLRRDRSPVNEECDRLMASVASKALKTPYIQARDQIKDKDKSKDKNKAQSKDKSKVKDKDKSKDVKDKGKLKDKDKEKQADKPKGKSVPKNPNKHSDRVKKGSADPVKIYNRYGVLDSDDLESEEDGDPMDIVIPETQSQTTNANK